MSEQVKVFFYDDPKAQRLDLFLVDCLPSYSRAQLQRLIREGLVRVGGDVAQKSGYRLDKEVSVEVRIPATRPSKLTPEDIPLEIIHEDDNLMVVNKAAGMVVHPSAGHASGTLVHAALAHAPDIEGGGGERRPGVVHRLDKHTSGIILLAKNDRTHRHLQDQFRTRMVEKYYLALVDGAPPTPSGRVEAAIGRDSTHRKRMAIQPEGKGREAISEYQVLERFDKHNLLEVRLITGRTHQIRVHMAFLGCPVVGDTVYGRRKASLPLKRHFLHAARLKILLPDEVTARCFEATLPEELTEVLNGLRA